MTKAEHNKILEELLAQVPLANVRDDVILMSQMMAADFQIGLMQKLVARLSPRHQAYQGLKAQVGKAVADLQKL
ncbi:hypothetical protein FXB42_06760 [Acetobacterium wieringae]|uniref:Uncharacterized protein n=1 Tax=Acetobacterium wieringae TaxID=52694 RepID=A0A5D0WRK7_9FIRM|nr:hypothetical protein [Acetobacterium wieringae]TYC86381.1 hypothetical protein FXB42_06760 [Acetobacterium wieringae]